MGAIILMAMGVYVFLAVLITSFIATLSKKKFYRNLAIIFFILLPTWDVALGLILYYPACLFVPKVAIYETAETDGIYYEGVMLNNYIYELEEDKPLSERIRLGNGDEILKRGFKYTESKITEKYEGYFPTVPITPVCYRCTPLPADPKRPHFQRTNCVIVDRPKSRYMVRETVTKPIKGLEINVKKVIDKSQEKLMAEYHQVAFEWDLPFFNWLYNPGPGGGRLFCPKTPVYYYFEFNVLKPKQ